MVRVIGYEVEDRIKVYGVGFGGYVMDFEEIKRMKIEKWFSCVGERLR